MMKWTWRGRGRGHRHTDAREPTGHSADGGRHGAKEAAWLLRLNWLLYISYCGAVEVSTLIGQKVLIHFLQQQL